MKAVRVEIGEDVYLCERELKTVLETRVLKVIMKEYIIEGRNNKLQFCELDDPTYIPLREVEVFSLIDNFKKEDQ